jgi:hypothetical protein
MRFIASILLLVIGLLTMQPLVAGTCRKMKTESCCKKKAETKSCCAKKDKNTCKKEKAQGKCCGDGICTACACCLLATVEKAGFAFTSPAQENALLFMQGKNALTGHLNTLFQPPEFLAAA